MIAEPNKLFVNNIYFNLPFSLLNSCMFMSSFKLSLALTSKSIMVVILRKSLTIIVTSVRKASFELTLKSIMK